MNIEQLALDAKINREELQGRLTDIALLTQTNPRGSSYGEGYGIKFRADHQQFADDVIITKNAREEKMLYDAMLGQLGQDASVYSIPSNGVFEYFTTVFNNKIIPQLLQTTASRVLTKDWQQGMFGTTDIFMPTVSYAGNAQVYGDLSGQGTSSINLNQVPRQTITLQRTIQYGDLTQAQMAMGKIDYVGQLRTGLASLIALDINQINLFGYSGVQVYGLANEPNLNPTLNAANGLWVNSNYANVILDIQTMHNSIISKAGGNADYEMSCYLAIPPCNMTALTYQNSLGTMNVMSYIKQTFPGMKIVQVQNYQGTGTPPGSVVPNITQLVYEQLGGTDVAYNIFSTLWNSHGVVRELSSYAEKISYVVSGVETTLPVGIATMQGC